ncbi:MAG: hypothetical protein WA705_07775 [Candidatus Ozemobacteraceae bacterium]
MSLVILSGTVVSLLGGMASAERLATFGRFEDDAAMLAERELETLKSDLLSGNRPVGPTGRPGRFRLHAGWISHITWTAPDAEHAVRVSSEIRHGSDSFRLESFVFVPEKKT